MNKTLVAMLVGVSALVASNVLAQNIATLDSLHVVNQTGAAKRALENLKKQRDAAQAKINQLEAPLIAKQKQLAEQQSAMSADKLKAEQEAFRKQAEAFRAEASKIQENLQQEGLKMRKNIAEAVSAVVAEIAKEKGYDLVIPKAAVVYAGPKVLDISDEVLKRANAKLDK
jgi:outer membrane protein